MELVIVALLVVDDGVLIKDIVSCLNMRLVSGCVFILVGGDLDEFILARSLLYFLWFLTHYLTGFVHFRILLHVTARLNFKLVYCFNLKLLTFNTS